MNAAQTAIATIGRCLDALAGELTEDERARVLGMAEHARRLLKAAASEPRLSTTTIAARVQALDAQLRDRDPGVRRAIICERLGISRSTYFRMRSLTKLGLGRETIDT